MKFEQPNADGFSVNHGIFNGYDAQFGFFQHKKSKNPFVGLPFIFIPAKDSATKKIIVVFNGGPGKSNLDLPPINDSLLSRFSILLPGYRGVDDFFEKLTLSYPWEHNLIESIVNDALKIIEHYNLDTLLIVSHSFGSVFAQQTMENQQKKRFTFSIYVSPMLSNDVTYIASAIHTMIQRGMNQCDLNQDIFNRFLTMSNLSPTEAMGLVFLFGKYDNILNFCTKKFTLDELKLMTQNEFLQYEANSNLWHRNRCLEEFLRIDNQKQKNQWPLANLVREYLSTFVKEESHNNNFKGIDSTNRIIVEAEFDYFQTPGSVIIKSTGHADVWHKSWEILPQMIRQKTNINF